MRLHFIGVGKMGLPMALHLRAGGADLSVSDNDSTRRALAAEQGLSVASDTALVLQQADGVFSSLPHDAALLKVAEQVATHARSGSFWVDTSTVSLTASAQAAQICTGVGIECVRTTVSGNNKMAEAAQLTVLASGPRTTYDRVLPLLQRWGPNQFYLGDAEQARLMKLVINLMIAQTSAMLGEALTLGRKGGLDWHDMWRVMGASAVASPIVKAKSAQLSERDFSATFTVNQMVKDLDLILGAASENQVPLPQTALTRQLMDAARAHGDADADYAAIIKATERSAGLPT
ncbi:NAD(P)-dependent oxidoreductase [Hydrogenophaga sp.]|uniref:NAD(P)-dependent oxidoreductase n=1 Tax=Hydrogenophaga sp. TaxID=1904254 RepID=UPI00273058FE|nr:NAD(P)-dependent oxidoreductase [Hydrogenophaga sp.]MDP2016034.1 NAD(P)-dependent oxidoreductase [Hydrogenophaga sp.]MDP3167962.1 NAD(P)-dependent oxidoreductase [Hydrogenophaga sp.]MDP3812438.1 NAD(P)-dependent oxidoreductase [Hydrogenophaga sp.]